MRCVIVDVAPVSCKVSVRQQTISVLPDVLFTLNHHSLQKCAWDEHEGAASPASTGGGALASALSGVCADRSPQTRHPQRPRKTREPQRRAAVRGVQAQAQRGCRLAVRVTRAALQIHVADTQVRMASLAERIENLTSSPSSGLRPAPPARRLTTRRAPRTRAATHHSSIW